MPYSSAGKHLMLNALKGTGGITHVSLHSGSPGDTGANELSGGSYARQPISFNTPSGGSIDDSSGATFSVPAGTVSFVGFWSAATGGSFLAYADVTDEVFAAAGTYQLTDADLDLNA